MSRSIEASLQVRGVEQCVRTMAQLLTLVRVDFDELDNVIEFDQEFWPHDGPETSVDVDDHLGTASNTARNQVRSS